MVECDICCFPFSESRVPKILTQCGHSICQNCIDSLSRNDSVECPHCRTVTFLKEVRTNYTLASNLPSPSLEDDDDHVSCSAHGNPVKVFCTVCWAFICPTCYETNDSVHSSHSRVSIEDGVLLVRQEMEKIRNRSSDIRVFQQEKQKFVYTQFLNISKQVDLKKSECLQLYNSVMDRLNRELAQVFSILEQHRTIAQDKVCREQKMEETLRRIENLTEEDFLKLRVVIDESLNSAEADYRCIHQEFDQIRIESTGSNVEESKESVLLPEIEFSNSIGSFFRIKQEPVPEFPAQKLMGKGKLLPYNRAHVRPYRPPWSWALPASPSAHIRRSPLQMRSEVTFLLPAMRCVEERRHVILECLERSKLQEGVGKQFSGVGIANRTRSALPDHLVQIYTSEDPTAAENLVRSNTEVFPMKRVFNLGKEYQSVWAPRIGGRSQASSISKLEGAPTGQFPYVDERAAVLRELTRSDIYKTRHRVNSDSHPKWAIRTIRRRRRRCLIKAKKRSISQDSIRVLQAKLLANQAKS